jgi:RNA polymerase sigma-70 factor (ECF subfamily)
MGAPALKASAETPASAPAGAASTAAPGDRARAVLRDVYARELDYVWRSLRRLGVRERDLEDLAHDVFVAFYRGLERFDPDRPVRPWLFGVAFRVVSDYRRRASYQREILGVEQPFAHPGPQPAEALAAAERRRLVAAALAALDLDQRAVFVMHELEGHAIPDISAALDIKLNTAYSRLRLARRHFADAVRRLHPSGEMP